MHCSASIKASSADEWCTTEIPITEYIKLYLYRNKKRVAKIRQCSLFLHVWCVEEDVGPWGSKKSWSLAVQQQSYLSHCHTCIMICKSGSAEVLFMLKSCDNSSHFFIESHSGNLPSQCPERLVRRNCASPRTAVWTKACKKKQHWQPTQESYL